MYHHHDRISKIFIFRFYWRRIRRLRRRLSHYDEDENDDYEVKKNLYIFSLSCIISSPRIITPRFVIHSRTDLLKKNR